MFIRKKDGGTYVAYIYSFTGMRRFSFENYRAAKRLVAKAQKSRNFKEARICTMDWEDWYGKNTKVKF